MKNILVNVCSSPGRFEFPPRRICILGAGRFGRLAVSRLLERFGTASFVVVDCRCEKLDALKQEFTVEVECSDALKFLDRLEQGDSTWIVPAIPLHVAFEWIVRRLNEWGATKTLPVPLSVESQVPNPLRSPRGTLYASYATFVCPDNCNEPENICTHTKKARQGNLFDQIARIEVPEFMVTVLRSRQLAPGVGGYPFSSLHSILEALQKSGCSLHLIATSCRCHGVIDTLKIEFPAG